MRFAFSRPGGEATTTLHGCGGEIKNVPPARILLWVYSIGVIALAGRSALLDPVPLWFSVSVAAGYLAVITAGVTMMRLEMFGDAVWIGDTDRPQIALTFDDGPSETSTPAILDALKADGTRATFFVIGSKAERHPELLRRIVDEGHEIGLHSYRHEWLYVFKTPRSITTEIDTCRKIVHDATGVWPNLFRPPVGLMSPRVAAGARKAGVTLVGWSIRTRDGIRRASKGAALKRTLSQLEPGSIVLLHDAAENDDFQPLAVNLLPDLLRHIEAAGYTVVPLADFMVSEA